MPLSFDFFFPGRTPESRLPTWVTHFVTPSCSPSCPVLCIGKDAGLRTGKVPKVDCVIPFPLAV